MPAALNMQDRTPVYWKGEAQRIYTPDEAEGDGRYCWADEDPHEEV